MHLRLRPPSRQRTGSRQRFRRAALAGSALLLAATALPAAAAPGPAPPDDRLADGPYAAVIRYTEYGIPHITAEDYPGLGFGNAWAQATDQICVLAEGFATVRGERSRWFGAEGKPDGSLSAASSNLASDLFFTGVRRAGTVERLLKQPPPAGISREMRELSRGWAAGYNAWLREHREDITDPACKGKPWLRPVTGTDVAHREFAFAVLAGQGMAVDGITGAKPPGSGSGAPKKASAPDARETARQARRLFDRGTADMGSNAVAFRGSTTASGHGMLLGNPHYPWSGGRRFWQSHMTIPGELDAAGGSLVGSPTLSIGHNRHVAWSHTVATGAPLNLHRLTLDPSDPTAYTVDGKTERMRERKVTVRDREGKRITRSQWWTRYGPVVTSLQGIDLPWTAGTAYALNDPNAGNLRASQTGLGFSRARDVDGIAEVLRTTQGLPWVNTLAADSGGRTYFAQSQVLPRVTDGLAARCNTPLGRITFPVSGLAVLDGSRSGCRPGTGPGAIQPGTFGPGESPVLKDAPYAENSNDSAWLTNADRPLTDYPRIYGDHSTARSLRTRGGVQDVAAMADRGGLTLDDLEQQQFANRVPAGDLAAADAARACAALPGGTARGSDGRPVDVSRACRVLAAWDRTAGTGSEGALLFDRFWQKLTEAAKPAGPWRTPFDPASPVTTPRDLNTAAPAFRSALADAVAELDRHGIPLDAPLGEHQFVERGGTRLPVPGGPEALGVWNQTRAVWDEARGGYREVDNGSSYIQAVTFGDKGCPVRARTLLTYSQSQNPNSPHHSDQTRLYSEGRMVRERFCERDVRDAPGLRTVRVSGG
ncbi:penicillin acylase family protein [Streptomyces sp. HNM0574]|uniref:penicillin acylase family protein n=1 Tax=Streptomyces sp. HNM0574 TaxID=2714954 RepID=UPI00146F43E1|nr:penicillin acylase family protein [Streptomyces sp. HNM0574]NLU69353.1 acylase [Streptomyces sp. HNM0574]